MEHSVEAIYLYGVQTKRVPSRTRPSGALGLKVVAEGVETAEQSTRLQELNCDLAKSSYFSGPLPVDEASEFLRDDDRP